MNRNLADALNRVQKLEGGQAQVQSVQAQQAQVQAVQAQQAQLQQSLNDLSFKLSNHTHNYQLTEILYTSVPVGDGNFASYIKQNAYVNKTTTPPN